MVIVFADTLITPERASVGGIIGCIRMYRWQNNNQMPISWNQLKQTEGIAEKIDHLNKSLIGLQSYPIEDHYQFVTSAMTFEDHGVIQGSQVLLIRTVPLAEPDQVGGNDTGKQYRYLIYQDKEGRINDTRISENDVQSMLKKSGVTITPKAGLPAVETEQRQGPDTTHTRQPNPADAAFLAQYPEYDPSKNPDAKRPPQSLIDEYKRTHSNGMNPTTSSTPQASSPHETSHAVVAVPVPTVTEEPTSSRWYWLAGLLGVAVAGVAIAYFLKLRSAQK